MPKALGRRAALFCPDRAFGPQPVIDRKDHQLASGVASPTVNQQQQRQRVSAARQSNGQRTRGVRGQATGQDGRERSLEGGWL